MESYNCNNGPPVLPPCDDPLVAAEGLGGKPYLGCGSPHTCNPIQDGYEVESEEERQSVSSTHVPVAMATRATSKYPWGFQRLHAKLDL